MAHAEIRVEVKSKDDHQSSVAVDSSKIPSAMDTEASQTSLDDGASSVISTNQFQKPNRTFSKGQDFRETPKYHDVESYTNQRHHYIGTGVFNADNIEDLPPRYRTKVLNAYEWLAATFPQSNMSASDLLTLDTSISYRKKPGINSCESHAPRDHLFPLRSQSLQGGHESRRGGRNQTNFSNDRNSSNAHESSNHSLYTNQNHLNASNSLREGSQPGSSKVSSRDSSVSSKYSDQGKKEVKSNNKFNNQDIPYSDFLSPEILSCDVKINPPKPKPNVKSSKYETVAEQASPKITNSRSDLQSVHSGASFSPASEVNKNIPNVHSKQTSRNEKPAQSTLKGNQSFAAGKKHDNSSNSRKNSFKPIENDKNRYSDISNTSNTIEGTNAVQNQKKLLKNEDSEFRSDNAHNNSFNRIKYQTSSVASDERFHDNKRNRNSSISNSHSSNTSKTSDDRKSSETQLDTTRGQSNSNSVFSNDKRSPNFPFKNDSDGRKTNFPNPSLQSPVKRQNSNRNRRGKINTDVQTKIPNITSSPSKNTYNSNETFLNRDQSKRYSNNNTELMDVRSEAQSRNSVKDESLENILAVISNKQMEMSCDQFKNQTDMEKTDKGVSKFSPNEVIDQKSTVPYKDVGNSKFNKTINTNRVAHSNYTANNNLRLPDFDSRRDDIRDNKMHSKTNFQNLVSSERSVSRRTCNDASFEHTRISSSRTSTHSNRTKSNSLSDSYIRPQSRSSPSSKMCSSSHYEGSKPAERTKDRKQTDRADANSARFEEVTSSVSRNTPKETLNAAGVKQRNCKEKELRPARTLNTSKEKGFFVSVNVSDSSNKEIDWQKFFSDALKHDKFVLDSCCKFTDSLILNFEEKNLALKAGPVLKRLKQKKIVPGQPHLILVGNLKYHRIRPCDCQDSMVNSCLIYFKEFSEKYIQEHQSKMVDIEEELRAIKRGKQKKFLAEQRRVLEESLKMLEDMEMVFKNYINNLKINLKTVAPNYFNICKLKSNFMRECQSFQRCLPIYSRKDDILKLLAGHSVTVLSAETGSGKSTQLAEYLLQSWVAERGTIICTQPRKIAAISITNYVCGKIGSAVGKLIGYDVGTEKKYDKDTKIIYMTDYALLRKFLRNPRLKGISGVIIDEAHERTLHTDLLLGMLKECLKLESDRLDLRIVITSATIDPSVFVRYFSFLKTAVIEVPGRAYPVEVVWLDKDVNIGWAYLKKCVETAVQIHTNQPKGDILVFLTSPAEIDEAILMFKDLYSNQEMPQLMSLHGKSDLQEQMRIFEVTSDAIRRIIFATNAAETSLTIPGIKYVIDCGMAKEMTFFPAKNKNCLMVNFINKSSAEQRKGRAGRTQPGVCYRMYSKNNFEEMPDRASPEILRTSLQGALLKIYEFGLKPDKFDFVESPSKESFAKSLESLELLDLIKDEQLTDLGKKVVQLPIEPQLAKLVLQGIKAGIGYEMIIIAAMVREAGRLFFRTDEIKVVADEKKIQFCQETGDLCTYLEVYKRWREVAQNERYHWCVENFISSKALNSAEKTMKDIIVSLHLDLSIHVFRRYNNATFKSQFENIIFNCFSENLCMYSGHPKVGYFSFLLNDSLYIHPSSSLYYLGKDLPQFLVYSSLMQTKQNFLMDVTPIKEEVLNKSYHLGYFKMSADVLKCLKILPKAIGPFGDIVLRNHIIGKGGSRIINLEVMIEKLTNSRNFKIDIVREKGTIVIYSEGRFHEKISQHIYGVVKEAHCSLAKEEDIIKMPEGFSYLCIGLGGVVNDIIMPGEFREITIENLSEFQVKDVETHLKSIGDLKAIRTINTRKGYKNFKIVATYMKVTNAMDAKQKLSRMNLDVKSSVFVPVCNEKETPIYRIQVSWSRVLSEGTGWVEFDSEADCICASNCLTSSSFCIGHNYIRFTPSSTSVKQLDMRNLPPIIEESVIEKKLSELLPSLIKLKTVYIKRKKLPAATNNDTLQVQKKLESQFHQFAAPGKIMLDVNCPAYGDPLWRALVYFENSEDGEKAYKELVGKLCMDSVLVKLNAIRKSHMFCKSQVFTAVKEEVNQLKREYAETIFSFNSVRDETMDIGFSCKSMEDLFAVQQKLAKLFQGWTIQCHGNKKFSHLFTVRGHQLILEIQKLTKTLIILDNIRKVISLYGPKENCTRAKAKIDLLVEKEISSKKKVFNLKNSSMPTGFLKCLYVKYGIDLQGLICDFDLKAAVLNAVKGTLTIEGSSGNLKKVEEHLEAICTELYNKHQTVKLEDGKQACTICLDPLSIDFHRLENCGHAFCKECLLLQVESKTVPLICVNQECGKPFFMVDINTLLSRGDGTLRKNFYDAALQHYVNANVGKISYCPIPDCYMVYRVTSTEGKHHCVGCQNTICTQCHTPFHYGMSCDIFRNCIEDEDYSLKVWMADNSNLRKQCPNCKVVIEKESGCNHMECLNCQSHLCWLCLEVFPTGKEVYSHLPYCPKNQISS